MGWRRDDELYISVKIDKQGILGKIAKVLVIQEELRAEVEELRRMISAEEMASSDEERSQGAIDSDN